MSKVMVVEDDASLREIYSIRITAEGYEVVSAGDGEEALAVAVREKPDLILSDVMMPKISGFDMLDILRSTPETANIKVVMMTALSSDDQRRRGERHGEPVRLHRPRRADGLRAVQRQGRSRGVRQKGG